jgi:hypothetical protein
LCEVHSQVPWKALWDFGISLNLSMHLSWVKASIHECVRLFWFWWFYCVSVKFYSPCINMFSHFVRFLPGYLIFWCSPKSLSMCVHIVCGQLFRCTFFFLISFQVVFRAPCRAVIEWEHARLVVWYTGIIFFPQVSSLLNGRLLPLSLHELIWL